MSKTKEQQDKSPEITAAEVAFKAALQASGKFPQPIKGFFYVTVLEDSIGIGTAFTLEELKSCSGHVLGCGAEDVANHMREIASRLVLRGIFTGLKDALKSDECPIHGKDCGEEKPAEEGSK